MCAVGILLALIDRGKTGRGQVVNTDMVMCRPLTFILYIHMADRCREHVMYRLFPSSRIMYRRQCQGGLTFWMAVRLFTIFTLARMEAGCQSDA